MGVSINMFIFFFIFWSCVMFVIEIQTENNENWMEIMFTIIFTIEYAFRTFGENNPFTYIFSLYGIIDLASIFPFYLDIMLDGSTTNLGFLRACRTMRALKLLSFIDNKDGDVIKIEIPPIPFLNVQPIPLFKMSAYYVTIIKGVLTVMVWIFVLAGIYVSIDGDAVENNFWMSLYYIIITITTVGYGDYSPTTDSGRLVICLSIIAALIVVPTEYTKIGAAMDRLDEIHEEEHQKEVESHKRHGSMHKLHGSSTASLPDVQTLHLHDQHKLEMEKIGHDDADELKHVTE